MNLNTERKSESNASVWTGSCTLLYMEFIYTHVDTREFITPTVELLNRCIKLSCYYNRV